VGCNAKKNKQQQNIYRDEIVTRILSFTKFEVPTVFLLNIEAFWDVTLSYVVNHSGVLKHYIP
jgi:hypothetical protein